MMPFHNRSLSVHIKGFEKAEKKSIYKGKMFAKKVGIFFPLSVETRIVPVCLFLCVFPAIYF